MLRRVFAFVILGLAACSPAPTAVKTSTPTRATVRAPADPSREIRIGDVRLQLSASNTAALFHTVDQISHWSPFTHTHYVRWAPPPDDAEAISLLERHAALRKKRGWGAYEPILYLATGEPGPALDRAASAGAISRDEANEETLILSKLAPRFASHLTAGESQSTALREALIEATPSFSNLFASWLAVIDLPAPIDPIPLVFVPSPGIGAGGGGANGGVLVVEVPQDRSNATLTTIAHEVLHQLLAPKKPLLENAARDCGHDLDEMTMNEALVYAIAPGSFSYGMGVGPLERMAASATPASPTGRFVRLALAVRPRVREAMHARRRDSLPALLDAVCEAARTTP